MLHCTWIYMFANKEKILWSNSLSLDVLLLPSTAVIQNKYPLFLCIPLLYSSLNIWYMKNAITSQLAYHNSNSPEQ